MNRVSILFSTFDRAAETYATPFAAAHAGVAVRAFTDAIVNPGKDTDISNHPDDFDLYEVGSFDSTTGRVIPCPTEDGRRLVVQGKQIALGSDPGRNRDPNKYIEA